MFYQDINISVRIVGILDKWRPGIHREEIYLLLNWNRILATTAETVIRFQWVEGSGRMTIGDIRHSLYNSPHQYRCPNCKWHFFYLAKNLSTICEWGARLTYVPGSVGFIWTLGGVVTCHSDKKNITYITRTLIFFKSSKICPF